MKKVLVIYFTQTGQLSRAVKSTLQALENDLNVELTYEEIKPSNSYPFPWSYMQFFDVFPETVNAVPCQLQPFSFNPSDSFDLIIVAYQPWFLSICIPINSFLQTQEAKQVLKNKPVITLIACRNMWLTGQEKMKTQLLKLECQLIGNITFVDKAANLISLITVLAFVLGGVKDKFLGIFPKYGVSDSDLKDAAPKYGEIVLKHLKLSDYQSLQDELITAGAITIKANLMFMEGRGKVLFPIYAKFCTKKGFAGSKERRARIRLFGILLPTVLFILSPIITIVSRIAPLFLREKIRKEVDYYSHNSIR